MPRGRIDARLDAIERKLAAGKRERAQQTRLAEWKANRNNPDWPGHTPVMLARRAQVEAQMAEWEAWDAEA